MKNMRRIVELLNNSTRKSQPKEVSKLYKKWLRYLKRKKLFDEYMFYMDCGYKHRGTYPYPNDYEELSSLLNSLNACGDIGSYIQVGESYVHVDWHEKFLEFTRESVQWWNFYVKSKYLWK